MNFPYYVMDSPMDANFYDDDDGQQTLKRRKENDVVLTELFPVPFETLDAFDTTGQMYEDLLLFGDLNQTTPVQVETSTESIIPEQGNIARLRCSCKCKCQSKGKLGLPLSTRDEFNHFERKLVDNENGFRTRLEKRLVILGGSDKPGNYDGHLRELLKFCFTNDLRTKFNWAGRKKLPFYRTELQQLLFETIRKKKQLDCNNAATEFDTQKVTDFELRDVAQKWLKASKTCNKDDDYRRDSVFPSDCQCKCECQKPDQIKLPVKSMPDFSSLDADIRKSEGLNLRLRNLLVPTNAKKDSKGHYIRKSMSKLMTEEVRVQLNWDGRGQRKTAFNKLEMRNVVFDSIRLTFPTTTDIDIKRHVQLWLKAEPKDKARARKSSSSTPTAPDDDDLRDL